MILLIKLFLFSTLFAQTDTLKLIAVPGTITQSGVTLFWEKPVAYKNDSGISFCIYKNDDLIAVVKNTIYLVPRLHTDSLYSFTVRIKYLNGSQSSPSNRIRVHTKPKGILLNVLDYGAKGDGVTINTSAIQKAIDECPPNGTVYVPQGIYLSGALFLKSSMTLYIDSNGTLKGSQKFEDYLPVINSRFEGWELKSFASLLTAGKLDNKGPFNIHDLTITGKGTISGGGEPLANGMIKEKGIRSRGRLICIMNGLNIHIQGLTVEESPSWTIHYIYSKNVTCQNLTIKSTVDNGDGVDPDSSTGCFILNCSFATNDDCIAIKSGKNPEGFYLNKPTENVLISECNFISGHALSIGSEMSGGIKDVLIRDCRLGNLLYGFQIKTTRDRGGVIEKIRIENCNLQQVKIITSVNYNNDGKPAPELPKIRDVFFSNVQLTNADPGKVLIILEGFDKTEHYTQNVLFEDVKLPAKTKVLLKYCNNIRFKNVLTINEDKPEYILDSCKDISW